ncbi:enterobactin transporter EntS, partial [Enterobacter hormaechei]
VGSDLFIRDTVTGYAFGAAIVGGVGAIITRVGSASSRGLLLAVFALILLAVLVQWRRLWMNL